MSKKSFATLILTTAAGLAFALGMCMCLIPQWNLFKPGVVVTAAGFLALAVIGFAAWVRAGRPAPKVNWPLTGKIAYGVLSTLVLGTGMSMILVFEGLLLPGILVGAAGLLMLLCLIPVCFGLK